MKSNMANGKFFNDKVSYDDEFDPRFAPRFAEIATFLRAPHRSISAASTSASPACRSTAARRTGSAPATVHARCATFRR